MSTKDRDERGLTRRGLFRGLGTAGLVAGCVRREDSEAPGESEEKAELRGAFGATPATLAFTLDGEAIELEVEARTTLLELLRLDLDRTGTKLVCDRGACGACMVMVDGEARNSCMLLAHDVAGREVTTVAGLAEGERLSPLQHAFVEHDALQCGFCTSGMLISTSALLARNVGSRLSREQVEDAIAGNLCRCGTYPHVVDATLAIANHEAPERPCEVLRAGRASAKGGQR
jgi:aerobic-type carbon monoxide dehydrogenase small subunit (CoxS/CutS family)